MSDLHMFAIVTGVSEYHVAGLVGAATSPTVDSPGITSSSALLYCLLFHPSNTLYTSDCLSSSVVLCLYFLFLESLALSLLALDMELFFWVIQSQAQIILFWKNWKSLSFDHKLGIL